jgi:hypothetical protein
MSGLWLIAYDLIPEKEADYLDWFHGIHIPEKLARPGYTWAAHYCAEGTGENGRNRYIALFGGEDSSVFYDPSPQQIKPNQPPETKAMMGCRANPDMYIASMEWVRDRDGKVSNGDPVITADCLSLQVFASDLSDQAIPSWLVQEFWPSLQSQEEFGIIHKYLTSTGNHRHVTLIESTSPIEAKDQAVVRLATRRIWPV